MDANSFDSSCLASHRMSGTRGMPVDWSKERERELRLKGQYHHRPLMLGRPYCVSPSVSVSLCLCLFWILTLLKQHFHRSGSSSISISTCPSSLSSRPAASSQPGLRLRQRGAWLYNCLIHRACPFCKSANFY